MTLDADPQRSTRVVWQVVLAYTAMMTVVLAAVSVVIAIPVIVRGVSTDRVSLLVLATAAVAACTVLLTSSVTLADAQTTRMAVTTGTAAAGLTLLLLAAVNAIRAANDLGWADATVMGIAIVVMIAARPLGVWLAREDRAERALGAVVDRSQVWGAQPHSTVRRSDGLALMVILIVLGAGLLIIRSPGGLGHDESIYALKARSWITDTPTTGWAEYRPLGMSFVAWIVLQVASTEVALRNAAIVLSIVTIATMWLTGRLLFDAASATLGTAVFAGTASFLRRATELLNDVSSAGLLLATMAVVWYQFERRPGSWWLLAAAPLAAGAYYMRYGSALGLVVISIIGGIVWWRSVLAAWRQVLATVGLLLVLLIPHFVYSIELTGSPLGIFRSASTSVGGGGGGLADYLGWLPSRLAGPLGATLMALAVVYAVAVWWLARARTDLRSESRTVSFLVLTAVFLTIALGAFTHGEPRFVFMPLMAILLTGARALVSVWRLLRPTPRAVVAAITALALLSGFAGVTRRAASAMDGLTDRRVVIVDAAEAVRLDAAGRSCEVRTSYTPQITWYAVCESHLWSRPLPTTRPAYLVFFENGKRQPAGDDLVAEIAATEGEPLVVIVDEPESVGDGFVFRYP